MISGAIIEGFLHMLVNAYAQSSLRWTMHWRFSTGMITYVTFMRNLPESFCITPTYPLKPEGLIYVFIDLFICAFISYLLIYSFVYLFRVREGERDTVI